MAKIYRKKVAKGGENRMLNSAAIHRNVRERSDAASVFERVLKCLIFVAGPAVVYLLGGWIIGLPFLR